MTTVRPFDSVCSVARGTWIGLGGSGAGACWRKDSCVLIFMGVMALCRTRSECWPLRIAEMVQEPDRFPVQPVHLGPVEEKVFAEQAP